MSIFHASANSPHHISAGAVLFNDRGEIACHYFAPGTWKYGKIDGDLYILMRESLEEHESVEQALARGLQEEFGATGEIMDYLGSLEAEYPHRSGGGFTAYKTTLYCLVNVKTFDPKLRDADDPEVDSEIQWHKPDFLIERMATQGRLIGRLDMDESIVVQRARPIIDRLT